MLNLWKSFTVNKDELYLIIEKIHQKDLTLITL